MSASEELKARSVRVDAKLIYIVDDDSMIGEVAQIILRMEGYRSKFFQEPEVALRALLEDAPKPALLLTDLRMTPINGMQLIQQSKPQCPELRTILYSGNASEESLDGYAIRPDAFLQKPFLPRTLIGLIRSTLQGAAVVAVGVIGLIAGFL